MFLRRTIKKIETAKSSKGCSPADGWPKIFSQLHLWADEMQFPHYRQCLIVKLPIVISLRVCLVNAWGWLRLARK